MSCGCPTPKPPCCPRVWASFSPGRSGSTGCCACLLPLLIQPDPLLCFCSRCTVQLFYIIPPLLEAWLDCSKSKFELDPSNDLSLSGCSLLTCLLVFVSISLTELIQYPQPPRPASHWEVESLVRFAFCASDNKAVLDQALFWGGDRAQTEVSSVYCCRTQSVTNTSCPPPPWRGHCPKRKRDSRSSVWPDSFVLLHAAESWVWRVLLSWGRLSFRNTDHLRQEVPVGLPELARRPHPTLLPPPNPWGHGAHVEPHGQATGAQRGAGGGGQGPGRWGREVM